MIVVTGGAGFIGSHLVKALNRKGYQDILIVDDLTQGHKFKNIVDCVFLDYLDKTVFLQKILNHEFEKTPITAIFHQGACTSTIELNGSYLMENNYEYSKNILHYALSHAIPFLYASSASIYGSNSICKENELYESPLNAYGYSKLLFDRYVRRQLTSAPSQVIGLRYFNVYGPNEHHKQGMKSVVQHFYDELLETKTITIFDGIKNCPSGQQRRDFIYVSDVVDVILWLFEHPDKRGILNLGTGNSLTFNEIAEQLIEHCGYGEIRYQPIPVHLRECYQIFTKADMSLLHSMGYTQPFTTIRDAIGDYIPSKASIITSEEIA